jgi:HlyD family secretion protein
MKRGTWLLVLGVLAAAASACGRADDGKTVHLNGRVEAPLVDLAPKVAGRVVEVLVREGDRVQAGQVLARLDLGDAALSVERDTQGVRSAEARYRDLASGSRRAEIAAAEAEVADRRAAVTLARRELERQEQLSSTGIGTARELDTAKAEFDRAQAALKMSEERALLSTEGFRTQQTEAARHDAEKARVELRQSETIAKEAELRAPADGVILHRMAEPGLLLSAGQPALTMAFANRLYVRTFVPEAMLGRVRPGQKAAVRVDAFAGRTFPAVVAEISPDAEFTPKQVETKSERVNLVYTTKVDLLDGWKSPLVPGQPAQVTVDVESGPK